MKRGLTVTVAAVAILVAGLSGCSSNKSSTGGSGKSGATTSAGGASGTKVIVDGKDQNVSGTSVVCSKLPDGINIAIVGSGTNIDAVLKNADPPEVKQVGLGNILGLELGYSSINDPGKASATKNGSSYKITGTASGLDEGKLTQVPFEIDVTCP